VFQDLFHDGTFGQMSRAEVCAATEAEGVTRRQQFAGVARPTRCDRFAPGGPGALHEGERMLRSPEVRR